MGKIENIVVIGSGNVAAHLIYKFSKAPFNLVGIWNRSGVEATGILEGLKLNQFACLEEINTLDVDLVLICVSDDAVASIIDQLHPDLPIAYTSGSVRLDQLPERSSIGVFYPLQTFSKNRKLDLHEVPFLIESANSSFGQQLFELAQLFSKRVQYANSSDRFQLHIAAVMVNNFTNHLFDLAKTHLSGKNLDFSMLVPLIQETVDKIKTMPPEEAQTGPAKRGDHEVINKHISQLEGSTKEVYEVLIRSISDKYNTK